MKSTRTFGLLAVAVMLLPVAPALRAAENDAAPGAAPRKTAIFVQNLDPKLNSKVPFLEDQVASRVGGKDFAVISRADVLNAVKVYPTEPRAVLLQHKHAINKG